MFPFSQYFVFLRLYISGCFINHFFFMIMIYRKGSGSFRHAPPRSRGDVLDENNFSSPDLQLEDDDEGSVKFIDVPGDGSTSSKSQRDQGKTGAICPKSIVRKFSLSK